MKLRTTTPAYLALGVAALVALGAQGQRGPVTVDTTVPVAAPAPEVVEPGPLQTTPTTSTTVVEADPAPAAPLVVPEDVPAVSAPPRAPRPATAVSEPLDVEGELPEGYNPPVPADEVEGYVPPRASVEAVDDLASRGVSAYRCTDDLGFVTVVGPGVAGFDPDANGCVAIVEGDR